MDDNVFELFHKYAKLVRRQLAPPLVCDICSTALITRLDDNEDLVLKCLWCDITTKPGVGRIDNVRAIVKEHFMEDK